ncbi:agmatinase [Dethiosulfatarculus sandiegensis]|uniref:Agmatinase n=1 Tax=Dethiosulfatarculus sandiegensis TaxID=1429043 RepID=A0A0D2GK36_9BACT|nr:agmatinase [Dethiosulfatarculus sandiegensis]KIX15122.1 agmatinase [Dethiosulfatarculus sandiegensis]
MLTFGGIPGPHPEKARASLIPVPLEETVCYRSGTSLGPAAIVMASCQMELYDEVLMTQPIDQGILTLPAVDVRGGSEKALARIEEAVAKELEAGRLPAMIGGEHTITLGALRALTSKRGADFTVLVLDAHLDLRESYEGTELSHACVMKRALDLGLDVRHLGARSCSAPEAALVKEKGLKPMWAHMIRKNPDWINTSLSGIQGPVYLSLDLDGLDPSCLAATGTPEPGGLYWHELTDWLLAVAEKHEIIGLDVVELAPLAGQAVSDFTAARLLYRALGLALGCRPL